MHAGRKGPCGQTGPLSQVECVRRAVRSQAILIAPSATAAECSEAVRRACDAKQAPEPVDAVRQLLVARRRDHCERLDALAEQYPVVSEALITISASVRSAATLLEVMDAIKLAQVSGLRPASA